MPSAKQELLLRRAAQTWDDVDRAFWPLMRLGVAAYGEFGFGEGVEALRAAGHGDDPEGLLFVFWERGFIYTSGGVVFRRFGNLHGPIGEKPLHMAFHVSAEGEALADLTWPDGEDRNHSTFGYHRS